ncbi:MAG TPA: tetratricopeptide repeat protein [Bryobacteraceae bacterium]|nr:tetratricopeptide repeat protein [Bryobacteraceae bacterium]
MRIWLLAVVVCFLCGPLHARQTDSTAEAQNASGEARADSGDLPGARDCFAKAIALKPDFGRAYMNLGIVSLQLHDTSAAETNLDRAVPLLGKTPDAGYALYVRAKIYSEQSQPAKAAGTLERAVTYAPKLAEAWSDLGEARKQMGDDRAALRDFGKAAALTPKDAVAQYRLGAEYGELGEWPAAVSHLQEAYALDPKNQSVLNSLQAGLRRTGRIAEANKVKQELAALLQERDRASQNALLAVKMNNEGAKLEKSGDLRAASQKYGEALQLDPAHVGIRVNYAVALLRLGEWTHGLNELHEALARDPGNNQIKAALHDAIAQAPPALVPKW